MDTAIKMVDITKRFPGVVANDHVNLEVYKGEILALVGENGAGKSTLMNILYGLHTPNGGEIYIDGISIKDDPIACKKKIAYIPDNPDLYEYMTARQYINFIQDVFEVGNERFERIEKYAKIFSIEKDLDQPIASFSHGMKQKTALIAAWVHQPKLVIMDEPFVGLDPTASHLLKQMMRELCEEGGAIFFSTHVLEVAEKLCDHIAIIKEGKLLKTGTMEEVKGDASLETVFLEMENESV